MKEDGLFPGELEIIKWCEQVMNESNEIDRKNEEIVEKIANELKKSESGWIYPNILNELVNVSSNSIHSCSKPFRLYQLAFSIKRVVEIEPEFISNHRKEIFEILDLLISEIASIGLGKMLYYKIERLSIIVLIKIYEPNDIKIGFAQDFIKSHIELLADKYTHTSIYPLGERWEAIRY